MKINIHNMHMPYIVLRSALVQLVLLPLELLLLVDAVPLAAQPACDRI